MKVKFDSKKPSVKIIHCGCCECYHRVDFYGDCRDDSERFDDLEDAQDRLGVPILETFEDGSTSACPHL